MLHPHTELAFIDERIGYGVVATRRIPRGTITWVLDELDQRIPPHRVRRLTTLQRKHLDKYAFVDRDGNWVLCWDLGRYLNHSCDPSCVSLYDFSMALRDIAPGEQLTDDYSALNLDETFACCCGTPLCRGQVGPDDFPALRRQLGSRRGRRPAAALKRPAAAVVAGAGERRRQGRPVRSGGAALLSRELLHARPHRAAPPPLARRGRLSQPSAV
jgi:hypothetical protein